MDYIHEPTGEAIEINLKDLSINFRRDGIIHVEFKEGIQIDTSLQNELCSEIRKRGVMRPEKILLSSEDFIGTERKFLERCKKTERFSRGQMVAVVAPNLAKKLIAGNYLYKYKPKNPFRIFDNVSDAVLWLTQPSEENTRFAV